MKHLWRLVLWGMLAWMGSHAGAQGVAADIASQPTPAVGDTPQGLATLTANASPAQVRAYFEERIRLQGDGIRYATALALYKAWNAALPKDTLPKEKLLLLLADAKQYDAAVTFSQPHFDAPDGRFSGQLITALGLYFSGRDDEVWTRAVKVAEDARREHVPRYAGGSAGSGWSPFRASSAKLGLAGALELQARVLIRKGHYRDALAIAEDGIDAAKETLDIARVMPPNEVSAAAVFQTNETMSSLLLQKIRAQVANGSNYNAARTLDEYLTTARTVEAHPRHFWNLAVSQYNQRNFVQAEANFRKADAAAQVAGYPTLSFFRSDCGQGIVGSLEGQKRWQEAQAELSRLDALAGDDETLQYRIRYRFERGYAYLHQGGRLEDALALFQDLATVSRDGILTAHANGLQGVTLWRLQRSPAQALALLKRAVAVYMDPIYFDDQALGLNADVRDLVVDTFMEAVFQTAGEDPMQAVGPAQWSRSSSVQSALADAAVRSAARDPALSELVRRDQDIKNEIRNLRTKAAMELDASVGAQISELTIQRAEIQSKIKVAFPEYDKLVAPQPPNVDAAVRALAMDEALVLLLPTDQSVFVWTISADKKNAAARAQISKAELQSLVNGIRRTLDFGEMNGALAPFDVHAARQLYRLLLAPVESTLEGKKHVIVAAGGALAQIPFGLLVTDQDKGVDGVEPYWIKRHAISHVPGLSAWLSIKQLAETNRATESLIAWGDPSFGAVQNGALRAQSGVRRLALTRAQRPEDDGLFAKGGLRYTDIPALPETREEVLSIASALKADVTADLHLGDRATKASVMGSNASGELARKKVVVFATHGLMAGDLPGLTQPALALANTDASDQNMLGNLLLLEDVLNLRLNSDWVVLSACNTAAADGKVEESLSGLARGFFYAGSRSLLVTHWAVESESAKELTTNTMKNFVANPTQRRADSLRLAMLTLLSDPQYRHPVYWAPYALVGDGGR